MKKTNLSLLRKKKKGELNNEKARELYKIMTSEEVSSLDMRTRIEELISSMNYDKDKVAANKLLKDWMKLRFGKKKKVEKRLKKKKKPGKSKETKEKEE